MNLLPRGKRNTIDRIGIEVSILRLLQRRKTALCRKVRSTILSRHLADAFVLRDGPRFAYKIGKHRSKLSGWIDDTGLHLRPSHVNIPEITPSPVGSSLEGSFSSLARQTIAFIFPIMSRCGLVHKY
jgi:hypothetical protein